jgi:hypothetical protein
VGFGAARWAGAARLLIMKRACPSTTHLHDALTAAAGRKLVFRELSAISSWCCVGGVNKL